MCVCVCVAGWLFVKSKWFISRSTSKRREMIYGVCRREGGSNCRVGGCVCMCVCVCDLSTTLSRMGCFGSLHVWCPLPRQTDVKREKKNNRRRCLQEHWTVTKHENNDFHVFLPSPASQLILHYVFSILLTVEPHPHRNGSPVHIWADAAGILQLKSGGCC